MIKIYIQRGKAKSFEDELYITWKVLVGWPKVRVYDRQDGPEYTILYMRTGEYEHMKIREPE